MSTSKFILATSEAAARNYSGVWESDDLLRMYKQATPERLSYTPLALEATLFSIISAVSKAATNVSDESHHWASHVESYFTSILQSSDTIVDTDDALSQKYIQTLRMLGDKVPEDLHSAYDTYAYAVSLNVRRLSHVLQSFPEEPPSAAMASAILSMSTLSPADLHRNLELLHLNRLLFSHTKFKVPPASDDCVLLKRRFFRNTTSSVLPQQLNEIKEFGADVHITHLDVLDELLVMCVYPVFTRRMKHSIFRATDFMHTYIQQYSASESPEGLAISNETLEAAAAEAATIPGEDSSSDEEVSETLITPADQSYLRLSRRASDESASLSILSEGNQLGFRSRGHSTDSGEERAGVFSCHDPTGCRIALTQGAKRSVVLRMSYPNGFQVSASTSGFVSVTSPPPTTAGSLLRETSRVYVRACVVRNLAHEAFAKDIIYCDGSRVLVLANEPVVTNLPSFYERLLKAVPSTSCFVRLMCDGSVWAYKSPFDEHLPNNEDGSLLFEDIATPALDAETDTLVTSFEDGRVTAKCFDGSMEVHCPDGTCIVVDPSGQAAVYEKPGFPTVEVDLAADRDAHVHSKGGLIPIAKGKDCVRFRLSCPYDGSAVMVKYDTRVAATARASVTVVRRARSVIKASQGGKVEYLPISSWTAARAKEFAQDSKDVAYAGEASGKPSNPREEALMAQLLGTTRSQRPGQQLTQALEDISPIPHSSYVFDLSVSTAVIRDQDYNRFKFDLFSKEGGGLEADLSGEIPGMKAESTFDPPFSSRAFVVSRDGRTTEVLTAQHVELLKRNAMDVNIKMKSIPPVYLSDKPNALQHSITRRRHDIEGDGYSFDAVFPERYWHGEGKRPHCAALAYYLRERGAVQSTHSTVDTATSRIFDQIILSEHNPLTDEELETFTSELAGWTAFCDTRTKAFDEYAVSDPRSRLEIEVEAEMRSKVKLLSKQIKTEKKKERSAAEAVKALPVKASLANIEEGANEDLETSDVDFQDTIDSDDEQELVDVNAVEINEAFSAFAAIKSGDAPHFDNGRIITLKDLRAALIQLVSQNVSMELIKEILTLEFIDFRILPTTTAATDPAKVIKHHGKERRPSHLNEVNITEEEFSRIFFRVRWTFGGDMGEDSRPNSDEESKISRSTLHSPHTENLTGSPRIATAPDMFPVLPLDSIENLNATAALSESLLRFPAGSGRNAAKGRMISTT